MKCDLPVNYSDFIRLCRVDDGEEWCDWLLVRPDGVYLKQPPCESTYQEKANWFEDFPTKNPDGLILQFPCSMLELQSFAENYGVYDRFDAFGMADWVFSKAFGRLNPALSAEYYSDDLKTLNRAAYEFWKDVDPEDKTTHPKNTDVAEWLKEQGYSKISAEQGASIIRPEWGAKGRR